MTKALSLKICCSWFLSASVLLGLLALTLWIKGEASTDVFIKALFLPLQLSVFRHSTYRWWVKLLLGLALISLVSLVLHLINRSWEVSLTRDSLLVLCPFFLILASLTQLGLTKTDRT